MDPGDDAEAIVVPEAPPPPPPLDPSVAAEAEAEKDKANSLFKGVKGGVGVAKACRGRPGLARVCGVDLHRTGPSPLPLPAATAWMRARAEKHYAAAIEGYTRAIELNPNVAVFWSNRAAAHIKLESYGSAVADAEKSTDLDPKYIKVHAAHYIVMPHTHAWSCGPVASWSAVAACTHKHSCETVGNVCVCAPSSQASRPRLLAWLWWCTHVARHACMHGGLHSGLKGVGVARPGVHPGRAIVLPVGGAVGVEPPAPTSCMHAACSYACWQVQVTVVLPLRQPRLGGSS